MKDEQLKGLYAAYFEAGRKAGCPHDQMMYLWKAGIILQKQQLLASAAARACDHDGGPTAVGMGGGRAGGKSFWLGAQIGADDCQRFPFLTTLAVRKVGKSNVEHFEEMRRKLFKNLPHEFTKEGKITFANGSCIRIEHYQNESDIDKYLGMEYDVIGIEEATTLTPRKLSDITTCCRSSKVGPDGRLWRPRIYSTTNPGGVGHTAYKNKYIIPYRNGTETDTRFIPALVGDNMFNNPDYIRTLQQLPNGWQKQAWLHGYWDIAAGEFFFNFPRDVDVGDDFDDLRARGWVGAVGYCFTHFTVGLLGCTGRDRDN